MKRLAMPKGFKKLATQEQEAVTLHAARRKFFVLYCRLRKVGDEVFECGSFGDMYVYARSDVTS